MVKNEAVAFLWQLWQEGIYTEDRYLERRAQVLEEIARSIKTTIVWDQEHKRVGKTSIWTQSAEELVMGCVWPGSIRAGVSCARGIKIWASVICDIFIQASVWPQHFSRKPLRPSMVVRLSRRVGHSSRIITASYSDLTIFSSVCVSADFCGWQWPNVLGQASAELRWCTLSVPVAFPNDFDANVSWIRNPQYELEDGSIVGDPSNVKLTQDIIDLGWAPPRPKTPWDLLPIVAVAENDAPALVEVPDDLRRLFAIQHPDYPGFNALGLRWYQFPALIRLGFDIGGLQYTATPFIEWYGHSLHGRC